MTEPILSPADLDVLAAEHAFGLLEGADKASALRRELEDKVFAARVVLWRKRGEAWIEDLTPEAVDDRLWSRIQAALGHGDLAPPNRNAAAGGRGWRRMALFATAACLAMTIALGVTLASRQNTQRPGPDPTVPVVKQETETNIAQIADKAGAPLLSAVYHPRTGTLTMRVSDLDTPDKAPELWVLDKAGKPHSLGLIDQKGSLTIELSQRLRDLLVEGATVAITVEDRQGAPHEAPTGEILGTAKLSTI